MGNPISLKLDGVVCARCHREIASIPMNVFVVRRLGTELIRCGQNKARDFSRALPLAVTPRQILCP